MLGEHHSLIAERLSLRQGKPAQLGEHYSLVAFFPEMLSLSQGKPAIKLAIYHFTQPIASHTDWFKPAVHVQYYRQ